MIKLYNTLSRKIEDLKPISEPIVSLYTCGPTVYDFAHIGNLRTYIFEDLLRRALEYQGLKVKHAMNITDVGHLTSDADEGEDKLEKGAAREGKHPLEVAKFYEKKFIDDALTLNILPPTEGYIRATETIAEQIEIIKILEEKGFVYVGEKAVYFDTSKLPDYGKLSGQKLSEKKTGARGEVIIDEDKKNPQDFALWFFLKGHYENHVLQWPSPWGAGFPGWHIECSAISRKALGQPFDIHTGGVDHIGTHHTNEIAQSEAAFGVALANMWIHGEFLLIDEGRMGKSEGNSYTLETLIKKGFSPQDFRYLCLTAHYRSQLNFTWESLESAQKALNKLYEYVDSLLKKYPDAINLLDSFSKEPSSTYEEGLFLNDINEDLNIPKALSEAWKLINNPAYDEKVKLLTLLKFDRVLGLNLKNPPQTPEEVISLMNEREIARKNKDFAKSDELRKKIRTFGYDIRDTDQGPVPSVIGKID